MKSAYLYVRVSTDEQKKRGYSLPEQEDRLIKHCESNEIQIKCIFREDYSAKNFNRPEWKKLITSIKKNSSRSPTNVFFVKWDRFSRNIELAYEMIGFLRKHNVTAMAIDQPIDFAVPESTVMLAVYLSVPDAENARRALNTANGMRRAKEMGRHPNKAPLGYSNITMPDGRKGIVLNQPNADIIKWCFEQLATNSYTIEEVRRMSIVHGLKSSRSNFWKIIRNPVYCGLIPVSLKKEDYHLVRAVHAPIISEKLFYDVQNIITTKRKVVGKTDQLKETFLLVGYLTCSICNRKLRGSYSKGSTKRYPYYHCSTPCKIRFRADLINKHYEEKLQDLKLSDRAIELLRLILEDLNTTTYRNHYLNDKTTLSKQLEEQDSFISKARKLFVSNKLQFDDFRQLREEYRTISSVLKKEINTVMNKLNCLNHYPRQLEESLKNILGGYEHMNLSDKKKIISLIHPTEANIQTGDVLLHLYIDPVLRKILQSKTNSYYHEPTQSICENSTAYSKPYFSEKTITIKKAIAVLLKNNIQVTHEEAIIVLEFLYLFAQYYNKSNIVKSLSGYRTCEK